MYIYSKLAANTVFSLYERNAGVLPKTVKQITILGGAGIMNKTTGYVSPSIITEVSDSDLEALKQNRLFMDMVEKGYIVYHEKKAKEQKVAEDMTQEKDGSAPITEDYMKKKKVSRVSKTTEL